MAGSPPKVETIRVMLPYPVSANRYWRTYRGRQVVSKEARAYKAEAAWRWKDSGGKLFVGYGLHVEVLLFPKLTKRLEASKVRMDLDNAIKVVLDAMNRVAFWDDSQVVSINARVRGPIKDGGLSVGVWRADGAEADIVGNAVDALIGGK